MPEAVPLSAVVVVALITLLGGIGALCTSRLSSTVVSVLVVVVGSAGLGLATQGPALAILLLVGGMGLLLPVAAGVVVVDLDGRPPRTLRPWRLLMLLPVVLTGFVLWPLPLAVVSRTTSSSPTSDAALLALLALASAGPAVLLLARRREAA